MTSATQSAVPAEWENDEFTLERYELRERPLYRFDANRREFVQILGAGIVVAVTVSQAAAQRRGRGRGSRDVKLSQRFHFDEDIVTVFTSKVEVGQGSRTQIAQAVAEELRKPVDRVRVVMADTQLCPDDGGTAGSRTTARPAVERRPRPSPPYARPRPRVAKCCSICALSNPWPPRSTSFRRVTSRSCP